MDDQSFESTHVPGRRTFFKRFVTGLGVAIGAILGVPLAGLVRAPRVQQAHATVEGVRRSG